MTQEPEMLMVGQDQWFCQKDTGHVIDENGVILFRVAHRISTLKELEIAILAHEKGVGEGRREGASDARADMRKALGLAKDN